MIKALLLIFDPAATWDKIVQERRGLAFVFFAYLLPLLLVGSAAEAFGLMQWGKPDKFGFVKHFGPTEAMAFGVANFLMHLLLLFATAKAIKGIGETFQTRHTYIQAFTVVGYGLSPILLLRVLNALPLHFAVPWTIGILLTIMVLYHGVPKVMVPDPSHAFGLYIMTAALLALASGALLVANVFLVQHWLAAV